MIAEWWPALVHFCGESLRVLWPLAVCAAVAGFAVWREICAERREDHFRV